MRSQQSTASTGAGSSGKWKSPFWTCSERMRSAHVLWTSPTTCSPRSKHSLSVCHLTCTHHMVAISPALTQQLVVSAVHMSPEHCHGHGRAGAVSCCNGIVALCCIVVILSDCCYNSLSCMHSVSVMRSTLSFRLISTAVATSTVAAEAYTN